MSGRREVLSWALYDWANSAFATVVMAGFFPVFFKEYWSFGRDPVESTFWLGAANSASSLVMLLSAPVFGAIADAGGRRKSFLFPFAMLGILATCLLFLVPQGAWAAAAILFGLATMGFMGGNTFYDALLLDVTGGRSLEKVSALGFAVGYLGGGILLALCVLMTWQPGFFGIPDVAGAVRVSFLMVSLWWLVFSIPLFAFVKEGRDGAAFEPAVRAGFAHLKETFCGIRSHRTAGFFLLAYWLYIDGVDTVVRMAVDYGLSLGFRAQDLLLALLVTQFVGFPASLAFGRLGERMGAKRGILLGLAVYCMVTVWGFFMKSAWEFYGIAITIGLVQGGVQLLSRSCYARLFPPDRAAEFFGFYNMMGKFAAVIGPFMVGWVSAMTGSSRLGILSLLVLFLAGAGILSGVRTESHRNT